MATTLKHILAISGTESELSTGATKLKNNQVGITTDTKRFVWMDSTGTFHNGSELTLDGTEGYFPVFDAAGTGLEDSPLDYNISNAGYVTSAKPMILELGEDSGSKQSYFTFKNESGVATIESSKDDWLGLPFAIKNNGGFAYKFNAHGTDLYHYWYFGDTNHTSLALTKGNSGTIDAALGINCDYGVAYSYLDILKSSSDYTNWHALYRQSGLAHGLTDLFPTTDTAFGILVNHTSGGCGNTNSVILRGTATYLGSALNTLNIESISPSYNCPAITLDGSLASGAGRTAMSALGHIVDINNNGLPMLCVLGSSYTGINTSAPTGYLDILKNASDDTNWSILLRKSGIQTGLTDLFPSTEYNLGILINKLGSGGNYLDGVILRVASAFEGSGYAGSTFKIESISPDDTCPTIVLDGSKKNGSDSQAMGATGHLLDIANNGSVVASFLGNGYTGIGTTSPSSILQLGAGTFLSTQTGYLEFHAGAFGVAFRDDYDMYISGNAQLHSGGDWVVKYANKKSSLISMIDGEIKFETGSGTAAGSSCVMTSKMTLLANGNFGVDISAPIAKLQVNSSIVGPITKVLTNNSATGLFTVTVADLQGMGGQLFYTIKAYNATDIQKHSGVVSFSGVRKGTVYTCNIAEAAQLEAPSLSTGALTDAWTISGTGGAITVFLNANSNLSSLTQISVTFTMVQNNTNTINLL